MKLKNRLKQLGNSKVKIGATEKFFYCGPASISAEDEGSIIGRELDALKRSISSIESTINNWKSDDWFNRKIIKDAGAIFVQTGKFPDEVWVDQQYKIRRKKIREYTEKYVEKRDRKHNLTNFLESEIKEEYPSILESDTTIIIIDEPYSGFYWDEDEYKNGGPIAEEEE